MVAQESVLLALYVWSISYSYPASLIIVRERGQVRSKVRQKTCMREGHVWREGVVYQEWNEGLRPGQLTFAKLYPQLEKNQPHFMPNQMQLIQESLKVLERDAFSTSSWGSQAKSDEQLNTGKGQAHWHSQNWSHSINTKQSAPTRSTSVSEPYLFKLCVKGLNRFLRWKLSRLRRLHGHLRYLRICPVSSFGVLCNFRVLHYGLP